MGPMGNVSMADETGRPSNKMIQYFAERARGGAGLITTGLVPVTFAVDPSLLEPGDLAYLPRIDRSRTVLAGWRDMAEGVHAHGARFFIQLTAGTGRVGSPECLLKRHKLPISASWNPNYYMPSVPCRPLTDRECRKIIACRWPGRSRRQGLPVRWCLSARSRGLFAGADDKPGVQPQEAGCIYRLAGFRHSARAGGQKPVRRQVSDHVPDRPVFGA